MTQLSRNSLYHHPIKNRFRGYFPVIIDVETAGFDAKRCTFELAAITLKWMRMAILQPGPKMLIFILNLEGRILILNLSNLMGLIFPQSITWCRIPN